MKERGTQMVKQTFCIFAVLVLAAASVYAEEEKYSNSVLGVSVVKPPGWSFITKEEMLDSFAPSDLKEAVMKMLLKYATAPLVSMTKYKEPYDDINPIFTLHIQPLNSFDASDPKVIVEASASSLSMMLQDFKIVQGPENTIIKGRIAGYMRINHLMKVPDGRTFIICSESWIIPRANYFFMVEAATRQDEKTGTRDEIQGILNSLVIEN